jgi:uncharacterized protein DUF4864
MRQPARILSIVLLLALVVPTAHAQAPDEAAIQETITRQLEAMNRDDDAAAFAIASPTIQTMFGDAANFMSMVARGYPQVRRSRGHRFLRLETSDGKLVQRVLIESEAGTVVARYEMVEIDGAWRINGCMMEKLEGA